MNAATADRVQHAGEGHRVIVGIDPGYRSTGYGVISHDGEHSRCLHHGHLTLTHTALHHRLHEIFNCVRKLLREYKPQTLAVEEVFLARNPAIAIKLGHARAAAIVATVDSDVMVAEYATRSIKLALTGVGTADKAQVAYMVRHLLGMDTAPEGDAADALAVALCHVCSQSNLQDSVQWQRQLRGRVRV